MAGPDILDSGPAAPTGRRPRWQLVAVGVVIAGVAALLAARSDPDPAVPAPTPVPSVAALPGPPLPAAVGSVGVGSRSAYALMARCNSAAVRACELRLFRRRIGAGGAPWTGLPLRFEIRSTTGGLPYLLVDGADRAVVLDGAQRWAYAPVAGAHARRQLALGPAVDRVPPDGLLLVGLCAGCADRLVVLDAPAGLLRPLRAQPLPAGVGVRSVDQLGDRVAVVSGGGDPAAGAASDDGGRTWRRFPVPRTAADGLEVLATPDGGAYLIGTRGDALGNFRLAGIWRTGAPGAAWRQLRAVPAPTTVRSALAGRRGLLIVDAGGSSWRLGPGDSFDRLRDPGPARPAFVESGPGGLLLAVPRGRLPDRFVLASADEGETWELERIPG